jgi:hypothetical protein
MHIGNGGVAPLIPNIGSRLGVVSWHTDRSISTVGASLPMNEGRVDPNAVLDSLYRRWKYLVPVWNRTVTYVTLVGSLGAILTVLSLLLLSRSILHRYSYINLLKSTGHVMHQQFNIQQLYALPTLYLCVLYLSENKQRLVPLTA